MTDVQLKAQPIEHKPYKESVLEFIDKDVSIFVRAAGLGMASTGCFYFAFSFTSPHNGLFIVQHIRISDKRQTKIVDVDGKLQATSYKSEDCMLILHNSVKIGEIVTLKNEENHSGTIYMYIQTPDWSFLIKRQLTK